MYKKVLEEFEKYVKNYDMNDKLIALKYRHAFKVEELMEELANRLSLSEERVELAKIIGLIHDIGRFEQLRKTESFSDIKNNVNHAEEAITYLFENNHIRDYIEEDKYDEIIKNAIYYHNKKEIGEMNSESLLFTKMIRDMDKVDIYRAVAIDLESEFKADEVTEEVLRIYSLKQLIPEDKVKTPSDGVLLQLGFINDINFEESYDILDETDNLHLYISMVKVDEHSEKLWKKVTDICYEKLREGTTC